MYLDLKYNISRDGKITKNKDSYLGEYYKLKLLTCCGLIDSPVTGIKFLN